jgi:hypothetical protein
MEEDIVARLKNDFTYHNSPKEKSASYEAIRSKALELALLIFKECPRGREQSSAFTRIEEAVMHANAGIARRFRAASKE